MNSTTTRAANLFRNFTLVALLLSAAVSLGGCCWGGWRGGGWHGGGWHCR